MHFGTDDIEGTRERLISRGVSCSEVKPFQRTMDTPSGPRLMRANVFFPQGNDLPSLTQVAQHITPELIFQPRYMDHPNGAKSVTEIIACDARPEDVAGRYARYTGHEVITNDNFLRSGAWPLPSCRCRP